MVAGAWASGRLIMKMPSNNVYNIENAEVSKNSITWGRRTNERRWHGTNTSITAEEIQTINTHRVQRETLLRAGLSPFWDVHVSTEKNPRSVSYRRIPGKKFVLFWPDYTKYNPYQQLLYAKAASNIEIYAGTIDDALLILKSEAVRPQDFSFHLHWLNFIFTNATTEADARQNAEAFLEKLEELKKRGARLVWTIHNKVSHNSHHPDLEVRTSAKIAEYADTLHLHSGSSVQELSE